MNHPFDEFSKSLSEDKFARRESLRQIGAVLFSAVLGPLTLWKGNASASPDDRPRRKGRRRPVSAAALGGKRDPCINACKRCGTAKQRSQCVAACRACNNDPRRLCGTCGKVTCADFSADPNCGACGNNCGARGQTCCGGRCIDPKTDPVNCGACGNACPEGSECVNGTCSEIVCPSGQSKCGSTCVSLSIDNNNCGACGNVCGPGTACFNGTCTDNGELCGPGLTYCFYGCTNLMYDPNNCGACGHQCGSGDGCSGGICTGTCVGC